MKAFVYWNIRKKVFSVRVRGRVMAHARAVIMQDVEFRVSEAGRQRVIKTGQKNVHAGIYGEITACDSVPLSPIDGGMLPIWGGWAMEASQEIYKGQTKVHYNPYEDPYFKIKGSNIPVSTAEEVYLHANKTHSRADVWAAGVKTS